MLSPIWPNGPTHQDSNVTVGLKSTFRPNPNPSTTITNASAWQLLNRLLRRKNLKAIWSDVRASRPPQKLQSSADHGVREQTRPRSHGSRRKFMFSIPYLSFSLIFLSVMAFATPKSISSLVWIWIWTWSSLFVCLVRIFFLIRGRYRLDY